MNQNDKEMAEQISARNAVPMKPIKRKKSFLRFLLLVVSYAIVAVIVWQVAAKQADVDQVKQQERAQQEIKETVEKVGKLMILPSVETELPQIIPIIDAAGLSKTRPFFADVKNGDQVLIYLKAQKAIIYRASENKIVNVGPVIADNSTSAATGSNAKASAPAASQPSTSSSSSSASSR